MDNNIPISLPSALLKADGATADMRLKVCAPNFGRSRNPWTWVCRYPPPPRPLAPDPAPRPFRLCPRRSPGSGRARSRLLGDAAAAATGSPPDAYRELSLGCLPAGGQRETAAGGQRRRGDFEYPRAAGPSPHSGLPQARLLTLKRLPTSGSGSGAHGYRGGAREGRIRTAGDAPRSCSPGCSLAWRQGTYTAFASVCL